VQSRVIRDAAREFTRAALERAALARLPVPSTAVASTAVLAAARRIGAEAQVKACGNRIELPGGKLAIGNVVIRKIHLRFSC
jgi:hypothetical protein